MKKDLRKKISQDDMRRMNNLLILKILREEGPKSMAELSEQTNLTFPSISAIITELENNGFVKNAGIMPSKRGRFPAYYEFNGDLYAIVSLAIRSDSVIAGLVNLEGKALEILSESLGQKKEADQIIGISSSLIEKLLLKAAEMEKVALGLGVSMHGIVDPVKGISIYPAKFNWKNYKLSFKLKERFDLEIMMDNDMNCMLLAEKWFGKARGAESCTVVNVDYGIGAGIMSGGNVLRGENFGAGQIGHIYVADNGIKCDCGKIGCLETVASEKAICNEVIKKLRSSGNNESFKKLKSDIDAISMEQIYDSANTGDPLAIDVIERAAWFFGVGISTLLNIINPKMLIITGGILRGRDIFFPSFIKALKTYSLTTNSDNLEIFSSELGEYGDIIGGAALWVEELFTGRYKFENR